MTTVSQFMLLLVTGRRVGRKKKNDEPKSQMQEITPSGKDHAPSVITVCGKSAGLKISFSRMGSA